MPIAEQTSEPRSDADKVIRALQLVAGLVLLVAALGWPTSSLGELSAMAMGLVALAAFGGVWPHARVESRSKDRHWLSDVFRIAFVMAAAFTLRHMDVSAALADTWFVIALTVAWIVILIRIGTGIFDDRQIATSRR